MFPVLFFLLLQNDHLMPGDVLDLPPSSAHGVSVHCGGKNGPKVPTP